VRVDMRDRRATDTRDSRRSAENGGESGHAATGVGGAGMSHIRKHKTAKGDVPQKPNIAQCDVEVPGEWEGAI